MYYDDNDVSMQCVSSQYKILRITYKASNVVLNYSCMIGCLL